MDQAYGQLKMQRQRLPGVVVSRLILSSHRSRFPAVAPLGTARSSSPPAPWGFWCVEVKRGIWGTRGAVMLKGWHRLTSYPKPRAANSLARASLGAGRAPCCSTALGVLAPSPGSMAGPRGLASRLPLPPLSGWPCPSRPPSSSSGHPGQERGVCSVGVSAEAKYWLQEKGFCHLGWLR